MLWKMLRAGVFVAALSATVYVTAYLARLPDSNCSTASISDFWSNDRAYKATLRKKDCNGGETIFYSVRIDAISPPLRTAWFTIRELEDDKYPEIEPTVRWTTARQIEITINTRTIDGKLSEHAGDDLTIVRVFSPSRPETFPSY